MKRFKLLTCCLIGFAVMAIAEGGIESYPTRMVTDVAEVWQDVKVTEDGKWAAEAVLSGGKVWDGGMVTASGEGFAAEGPVNAFDGNPNSKYCVQASTMWLQYQYPNGGKEKILAYTLTSANDNPARDPRDWELLGSNDGKAWDELDRRSGEDFADRYQTRAFDLVKPGEYSTYRLVVMANHGGDALQIAEVDLLTKPAAAAEAAPAADAMPVLARPFNGSNFNGWSFKGNKDHKWTVGTAVLDPDNPERLMVKEGGNELINCSTGHGQSLDIFTGCKYGDARIEIEVMVPKTSNSGIYLQGEYEVQVLDSYGKEEVGMGDMGAIYSASVPRLNASKGPGVWQKYEIYFRAPEFDAAGAKTKNAFVEKVLLNGQLIQEYVEIERSTGGGLTGQEHALGPLMFQGDHGAVAFRNIVITPLPKR